MNNPKKKILFMILTLRYGGAEKVLVNLVNNLDKSKYDITLYSIFDDGVNKEFLDKSIRYQYKFKRVFRGNSHLIKLFKPEFLYKWFVKETYDIVISYLEGPTTRIIGGCNNLNTKKVAWVHIELNDKKKAKVGFKTIKEAQEYYEKFDVIVGVSKNVLQFVQKYITTKTPQKVLYNTNETEIIKSLGQQPIDININSEKIKVCSVAKVAYTKGFDRLLTAHKQLIDEGLEHEIYIMGIGSDLEKLKTKAKELGVDKSFIFLGFDKNPYKYMAKSDVYICSSRREGFSTAVTEALVLGIPVVSTEVSGANELLGDNNEFGLVVENSTEGIYQGLKEMLIDEEKRKHYRNQARIRGSFFSKEHTVKAVEDFIDHL